MNKIEVINLSSTLELPKYSTPYSDAMDVMACFDCGQYIKVYNEQNQLVGLSKIYADDNILYIAPRNRVLIPTGLKINCGKGYRVSIKPRSGLALKEGLTVLNTPGTVDADYRGVIGVILINLTDSVAVVKHGDRIAQLSFEKSEQFAWDLVDELDDTDRGEGGFGHTGK